jgi:hypothetical protein
MLAVLNERKDVPKRVSCCPSDVGDPLFSPASFSEKLGEMEI